jgi:uncharacterized RDD family membrane protein YckC
MECRYCRATNSEEEHRCTRCGRRLHNANARPAPDAHPIHTATAPALAEWQRPVDESAAPPDLAAEPSGPRLVYQRPLFQEMPRVLPVALDRPRPSAPASSRTRPRRRAHEAQHAFDFNPRQPAGAHAEPADSGIYCDAPVALRVHRGLAAVIDGGIIAAAMALFVLTFHVGGGEIELTKPVLLMFGAAAALLMMLYRLLFAMGNGDTVGYRWAQLRLLNFDGQTPTRRERLERLFGGCLSVLASGVGVLWALVDEETLTWHDHISRTFPTPDIHSPGQ